ncbi:hypothetical protein M413DRAFT_14609 [Hebeloma cylindrosporum]|uniref:F-box domain-containing protein n=1 Tax=Hebeloma cylindrosporum TaxID=76867 RepID=A0A0C3BTA3_HEBCY|nr:hypothetical protein M413DRAFT_14609 [Hebeloma cylindrosporum h7]
MASETSPLPHLFQTNAPPTEYERIYILGRIQLDLSLREELETLFSRPGNPHSVDLQIIERMVSFSKSIINHQKLLSPLRYFPRNFFRRYYYSPYLMRVFSTDLEVAVQEPDYQYILGLSQVCSYWRKVALSTQGLWTSIPFLAKLKSDTSESESLLQFMRMFIERSGNAPIHVTVLIHRMFNDLEEDAQLESPCLDLLTSHCHRWKTAILHVDKCIVDKLVKLYTPMLDSLNFRCRYPTELMFPETWDTGMIILAPHLRHLIVDDWQSHAFLIVPMRKVLTFTGLPWELESMRPTGPNLNTCTFRGPVSSMAYPTEPIRFDKLRILSIENNNCTPPDLHFGHEFDTPFRWIAAPNLKSLTVKGHPTVPGASLVVSDLLLTTLPSSSMLLFLYFNVRA